LRQKNYGHGEKQQSLKNFYRPGFGHIWQKLSMSGKTAAP
jgi:hypothetical protein